MINNEKQYFIGNVWYRYALKSLWESLLKPKHRFLLTKIVSAEIRSRHFARFLVISFKHICCTPIFDACVNMVCHFASWTRNNTMPKGRKKCDVTAKLCHYRYRRKLWQRRNIINFSSDILWWPHAWFIRFSRVYCYKKEL